MNAPWHASGAALRRVLNDLVIDEVGRLRPGATPLPPPLWPDDSALGANGFGLDSLERYTVAAAIAEMLDLHASTVLDELPAAEQFGQWCALAGRGLAEAGTHLTFRTSGSTGSPKRCRHEVAALDTEADSLAACIAPRRRVLVAVPVHHIYGFIFGVLLPPRLGAGTVLDVRRRPPQALQAMLEPGDLLVSHPAHWALVDRFCTALPADVVGVTSTAPCPDPLADALIERGLSRLLQIYGSSETAGVGWRDRASAPYTLMPHWQRTDGAAAPVRASAAGDVQPADLQDVLEWLPDGRFTVGGRRDEAVQVSGVNVFPGRVRAVILTHPGVQDCAVRRMSASEGERLKAFVVPRTDADTAALLPALEAWTKERLSAPECPRAWTFGPQLPTDDRGKLRDWPAPPSA